MSPKEPLDHLLSTKKASVRKVPICMDSEVADAYAEAKVRVDLKRSDIRTFPNDDRLPRELEDLEAVLEEATARARDCTVTFKFRSLGRKGYEDLIEQHKPTKKQVEDAKKEGLPGQLFNVETFPIALVAACMVDPKLSEDDVKKLWNSDEWNDAELAMLWEGAYQVNSQRRVMDLGEG